MTTSFIFTIWEVRKARMSLLTGLRPPFGLAREIHFQYKRAMTVDDRFWCDQGERPLPTSPELSHTDSEQLVPRRESPTRPVGLRAISC